MVGWHHQHNGHEFGWTPGVGDEKGSAFGAAFPMGVFVDPKKVAEKLTSTLKSF